MVGGGRFYFSEKLCGSNEIECFNELAQYNIHGLFLWMHKSLDCVWSMLIHGERERQHFFRSRFRDEKEETHSLVSISFSEVTLWKASLSWIPLGVYFWTDAKTLGVTMVSMLSCVVSIFFGRSKDYKRWLQQNTGSLLSVYPEPWVHQLWIH